VCVIKRARSRERAGESPRARENDSERERACPSQIMSDYVFDDSNKKGSDVP